MSVLNSINYHVVLAVSTNNICHKTFNIEIVRNFCFQLHSAKKKKCSYIQISQKVRNQF